MTCDLPSKQYKKVEVYDDHTHLVLSGSYKSDVSLPETYWLRLGYLKDLVYNH